MRSKFLQLAAVVLGLSVWAAAGPVSLTFVSGGGSSPGGIPYYPYTVSVNGTNLTVACDDFLDHVNSNESYTAYESNYSDLSHTLFFASDPNGYAAGVSNGTQAYDELAYLFTQMQPTPPANNTQNAAINYAMWELFDGGTAGNAYAADPTLANSGVNNSQYWLAQAAAQNYANFNFTAFVILSPTSDTTGWTDGRPQEFIGEVPEPATLALLGTGLLLLGLASRRRLAAEAGR